MNYGNILPNNDCANLWQMIKFDIKILEERSGKKMRKLSNHAYDTKSIFDCIRLMVLRNHTILWLFFLFIGQQQNITVGTSQIIISSWFFLIFSFTDPDIVSKQFFLRMRIISGCHAAGWHAGRPTYDHCTHMSRLYSDCHRRLTISRKC